MRDPADLGGLSSAVRTDDAAALAPPAATPTILQVLPRAIEMVAEYVVVIAC
jgi:hypothetical protein